MDIKLAKGITRRPSTRTTFFTICVVQQVLLLFRRPFL